MSKISIIDYGMGNLHSVIKAFEVQGIETELVSTGSGIDNATKLVLPGVGAFRDAIETLKQKELVSAIHNYVATGKPLLGVCLGMQLLFDVSYEDGEYEGLGLIKGSVEKFDFSNTEYEHYKVPHMGWNVIDICGDQLLFKGLHKESYVYFVHSYYVAPQDNQVTATTTQYGINFTSSVRNKNVMATQFHPEKSQKVGLKIYKNFSEL